MEDFDSGTKIAVSTITTAQIGRLIQNTARQSIRSINVPPTIGPRAIEIPTTAPQIPTARARSTRRHRVGWLHRLDECADPVDVGLTESSPAAVGKADFDAACAIADGGRVFFWRRDRPDVWAGLIPPIHRHLAEV
jgi:hypothetical protein